MLHKTSNLLCNPLCQYLALCLQGLEDVIGVSIVHSTMQRTRPDDPNDEHVGWVFVDIGDPPLSSPAGKSYTENHPLLRITLVQPDGPAQKPCSANQFTMNSTGTYIKRHCYFARQ